MEETGERLKSQTILMSSGSGRTAELTSSSKESTCDNGDSKQTSSGGQTAECAEHPNKVGNLKDSNHGSETSMMGEDVFIESYLPMPPEGQEQDQMNSCGDMSTLTHETAFMSLLFPKTRKGQWMCLALLCLSLAGSIAVAGVCGTGLCSISSSYTKDVVDGTNTTVIDESGVIPTGLRKTQSPSPFHQTSPSLTPALGIIATPGTQSPSSAPAPIESTIDLYAAVDRYLETETDDPVYGRIGQWDVSRISDFSNVFDARRNPLAYNFTADLNGWNTMSATTLEAMFYDARSFNGNISHFNTSSVTNMRETLGRATTFAGDLSQWDVSRVTDMSGMFRLVTNFNADLSAWDTKNVVDMSFSFLNCFEFKGDGLRNWDTSNVKNMEAMFTNTPSFNADLARWNVSKVSSMRRLFRQATAFNSDLSRWDVSRNTNMNQMFTHAVSFNADISQWDISSVSDASLAFYGASTFKGDLSPWNVSSVLTLEKMFAGTRCMDASYCSWARQLQEGVNTRSMFLGSGCEIDDDPDPRSLANSTFCQDCGFAVPNPLDVISTTIALDGSSILTDAPLAFTTTQELYEAVESYNRDSSPSSEIAATYGHPIGTWNVSLLTDFSSVFDSEQHNTSSFNEPLTYWDTSRAVTMKRMFAGARKFNGDVSQFETSSVRSFSGMFNDAVSFKGDISRWNTSSSIDMSMMFAQADLFNGNLSLFDTSNVEDFSEMFQGALSFEGFGLENWDTSSAVTLQGLFEEACSFQANIKSWNISNVVNLSQTFQYAAVFNADLSLWDVSRVEQFFYTFSGTASFNRDISSWSVQSGANFIGMFSGAKAFNQNLCDWGPRLSSSLDILTRGMFVSSACIDTDDPFRAGDLGFSSSPFCRECHSD